MEQQPKIIDWFSGEHAFLSNFEPRGKNTVEHRFQAAKTLDPVWKQKILDAPTPNEAKKLGRKAPCRADWSEICRPTMLAELRVKFADPVLRSLLLSTDDAILVEGNFWHDQKWGDCRCNTLTNPRFGVKPECKEPGKNWLGELLMQVREECKS